MSGWPYPGPEHFAVHLDCPKAVRVAAQRAFRAEQYAIVAELDAYRDSDGRPYAGQECARYRDSRGIGVDRFIRDQLATHRRSRRAPPHLPWTTLLRDWTPERRCAGSFAEDAAGHVVHHDDPRAVRWCLGGWLAHRCMKPSRQQPHRPARESWWSRSDDREARRLLDEVWALVPERTRAVVERIRRARLKAPVRKRLDQHPLGYWWFLAPHLAERFLQIEPGPLAPLTRRMLDAARDLNVPIR